MAELKATIAVLSDYLRPMSDNERWVASTDGKSAIYVTCPVITEHGAGQGFVWARIDSSVGYSCYCSPNCTLQEFDVFLGGLEVSIRQYLNSQVNIIAAGDLNAHSTEWGSAYGVARGSLLSDLVSSLGMIVCNSGSVSTYRRVNASSVIDVTFARPLSNSHPLVTNWEVLEHLYSASDHLYISYTLTFPVSRRPSNTPSRVSTQDWSIKKLNQAVLNLHWDLVTPPPRSEDASADVQADGLNNFLETACDEAMPPRTAMSGKKSVYWWNQEISELRKADIAALRRYQRAGHRPNAPPREAERKA